MLWLVANLLQCRILLKYCKFCSYFLWYLLSYIYQSPCTLNSSVNALASSFGQFNSHNHFLGQSSTFSSEAMQGSRGCLQIESKLVEASFLPHSGIYPVHGWKDSQGLVHMAEASSNDNGTVIEWGQLVGKFRRLFHLLSPYLL